MKKISLYFHVPYCRSKCYYCDFISYDNVLSTTGEYFNCVINEIEFYSFMYNCEINSIFFGGGTPSVVDSKYLINIIEKCKKLFYINDDIEITVECNPESLTYKKLIEYKYAGINRISIGLQAWQNSLLEKLGRVHTIKQFEEAFYSARNAGFNNINVDLIFSLPDQQLKDWIDTLKNVVKFRPEHISCYSLCLEEGTKLNEQYENKKFELPNDETNRTMYYSAQNILSENGYLQYEISNFAIPGFECKHNITYWTSREYIGFGIGANSLLDGYRTENVFDIYDYIFYLNNNMFPYKSKTLLTKTDQITEYIIMALRLTNGINKKDFYERFNCKINELFKSQIQKFIKEDLLYDDGENIYLTKRGLDLSNTVMCEFC